MTEAQFGKLEDIAPRCAWREEARDFTPWLFDPLDHVGEAIGIPLEGSGKEVTVEGVSADIFARNPQDGSLVLIENQPEQTDHKQLGQIMSYLAGLEAPMPTVNEGSLGLV